MFQASVNDIIRHFMNHFVFVYMDVILIFSKSCQNMRNMSVTFCSIWWRIASMLKAKKCVFHIQSVTFLGLVVEKSHLWGDPGKIKAVVTRAPEWRTAPKVSRIC